MLLFLHADTRLPDGWDGRIRRALADPRVVGGAFDFSFAGHASARGHRRQALRLVQVLNRARFRITRAFYGDQAIFCRRDAFIRLGGFPEVSILEDARFSRRLDGSGRTAILQPPVKTSPRRFLERGVARQMALNLSIVARDLLGLPVGRQSARYRQGNACDTTVPAFARKSGKS